MAKEVYNPTEKSAEVESAISSINGGKNRRAYILAGKCIITGEDAGPFRDDTSRREYEISGMGQKAQDDFWSDRLG